MFSNRFRKELDIARNEVNKQAVVYLESLIKNQFQLKSEIIKLVRKRDEDDKKFRQEIVTCIKETHKILKDMSETNKNTNRHIADMSQSLYAISRPDETE